MTLDSSRLDSRTGGHDRLDRRGGMWWILSPIDFLCFTFQPPTIGLSISPW
ncbi:MAG: hypothetical protein QGG39_10850 [Candidatus Poribacteria bacterium]|nr:hypothetical protein [Candidatus Poribacteria bacterium]